MVLRHEQRVVEFSVESHMENIDHHKGVQQLVNSQAREFMLCYILTINFRIRKISRNIHKLIQSLTLLTM